MHLGLTKSRDDKLLQDLLDKKLRVIVVFEDDYLNHIARIAYKDIQQDNYTYRIGEYNIYKGEEWGFCDFCKRHDCYFIVPSETIEGGSSEIPKDLEEAAEKYVSTLCDRVDEGLKIDTTLESAFKAGAKWQKEQMMKEAVEVEGVALWQYLDKHGRDFYRVETNDFTTHGEICDGDKVKVIIVKEDAK